jgi:hypothetical protein
MEEAVFVVSIEATDLKIRKLCHAVTPTNSLKRKTGQS